MVHGLSTDLARVVEVARTLPVGGGNQGVGSGLALADALCNDKVNDEIILLSDGAGVELPSVDCPVYYLSVGTPRDNAGISTLTTRRADRLGLSEVLLAVDHVGRTPRSVVVELREDDRLVDVVPMELPAAGSAWALRSLELSGEVLTARITGASDGLPADDVAAAVQAPPPPATVLLVTDKPDGFVSRALGLHPGVSLTIASPAEDLAPGPVDLLVLEQPIDTLPTARRVLAFGEGSAALVRTVDRLDDEAAISRWEFDHELFRYVDLQDVQVRQSWSLDGGRALVEVDGQAVAVATEVGGAPAAAFGFRPSDTDLVLRVGFVNLLANAVEWASPQVDSATPAEVGKVWPGAPVGGRLSAPGTQVEAWRPVPAPGLYTVFDAGDRPIGRVATAPSPPSEVDLTPQRDLGVPAVVTGVGGTPWWVWLLTASLCLLGIEWLLSATIAWVRR